METNKDKFQVICIGKKTYESIKLFQKSDTIIDCCESNITLLGVKLDFMSVS